MSVFYMFIAVNSKIITIFALQFPNKGNLSLAIVLQSSINHSKKIY